MSKLFIVTQVPTLSHWYRVVTMTPETRQNHLSSINIINVFSDTSNTHDHIKITPWEREMNHIATGRALSLGGELLPPHHGSQQRRWRWRWSRWRWLRGHFPVPAACRNRDFCPPKLDVDGGGATELFVEYGFVFLGFSSKYTLFGTNTIIAWNYKLNYETEIWIITHLLLPLGHISNR